MSTLKSLEGDTAKLARTTTQNLGSTVFDISLVYFSRPMPLAENETHQRRWYLARGRVKLVFKYLY